MKKTALITGASAGIGEALAKEFAKNGCDLILTARREDRLRALGKELSAAYGVECSVFPQDLSDPDGPRKLYNAVVDSGHHVDVLVNNAGYSVSGIYSKTSWEDQSKFLQVMITAVAELCHLFLPMMMKNGYGRIVNVSSITAFLPSCPGMTMYAASKSFLVEFTETLRVEAEGTGVKATALCPGFVESEFFDVNGASHNVGITPGFVWMSADRMARLAYRPIMKGNALVVPGLYNQLITGVVPRLPRRLAVAIISRVMKQFNVQDPKAVQSEALPKVSPLSSV